jgi:hypothetical protein
VIFAIAIIAIALYQPPLEEGGLFAEFGSGMETYEVEWETEEGSLSDISEYASKSEAYETTVSINKANLKSVTFNLSWTDDKAFLGRLGRDTLTLEITDPDGDVHEETAQSEVRTKEGRIEITIDDIMKKSNDLIEADNEVEAKEMLMESPYYDDTWKGEYFEIRVIVSVGEILGNLRPRDKGNSFDLEITYEYFDTSLVLVDDTRDTSNQDLEEDINEDNSWKFAHIVHMSRT